MSVPLPPIYTNINNFAGPFAPQNIALGTKPGDQPSSAAQPKSVSFQLSFVTTSLTYSINMSNQLSTAAFDAIRGIVVDASQAVEDLYVASPTTGYQLIFKAGEITFAPWLGLYNDLQLYFLASSFNGGVPSQAQKYNIFLLNIPAPPLSLLTNQPILLDNPLVPGGEGFSVTATGLNTFTLITPSTSPFILNYASLELSAIFSTGVWNTSLELHVVVGTVIYPLINKNIVGNGAGSWQDLASITSLNMLNLDTSKLIPANTAPNISLVLNINLGPTSQLYGSVNFGYKYII